MIASLALLLVHSGSPRVDPAQSLYRASSRKIAAASRIQVEAGDKTYRFWGKRYRLDSPKLKIVCDGHRLYRKEADKPASIVKAPREWPDDTWLRGFETKVTGPYHPDCTNLKRTTFAEKPALSVDTRYSESPMFSSNLFFDPKTKLPLGYRSYSQGQLDSEVIYRTVKLSAKLTVADFAIPKN